MNFFQKIVVFLFISGIALLPFGDAVSLNGIMASPQEQSLDYGVTTDSTLFKSYPVRSLEVQTYEDLQQKYPLDLSTPTNVKSQVEYDPATGNYIFRTKVGDMEVSTPFVMSDSEYKAYTLRNDMSSYFKTKNAEAQVIFGIVTNRVDNPSLSERLRKTTNPDFDEKIQLNVNGKVGDKINFAMNYNTDATFETDQQTLKLSYEGKEDEILRKLQAGNVSMPLNSSLIRGSSALFGFKAEMQFGKLNVTAIASQQQSQSKTVSSKGGSQRKEFEVPIDAYDENRHFFLAQYFRDTYDQNMSKLPYITSGVTINRVEVWVTNKRGNFDQARNILAFMDLAENKTIDNSHWGIVDGRYPQNSANTLYDEVKSIGNIRDIQLFNSLMETNYSAMGIEGGEDYEKIESARRLEPSEYTLNSTLGFISLKGALNADEVLAVAFEYTVGGKVYQVGEFSTDGVESPNSLIVKLLKGTAVSPHLALWDLMMKNVYYIGGMQIQKDKFKLDVQYKNDSTGVYVNYLTEGKIKNKILLKVMNLDRLDSRNEANPDGKFDYVDGYTINSSTGRVYFPVVEP